MVKLTQNHKLYEMALRDHDLLPVIAYGTAGTGKTYGACKAAVQWFDKQKVVVTRPNVSFAEKSGFLPGTEREKMEPWIRPIAQAFDAHGVNYSHQDNLEKHGKLTYMPLEYVQGLTWDNTFIILDEVQNMTFEQLKVFLTRTGQWSKVVLCGDIAQISPMFRNSGLKQLLDMVEYFDLDVHTIGFTREDVVRGKQCKDWIVAFEEWQIVKESEKNKQCINK
jgi:phosphate starvation-inducible PhoH-like protein